MTASLGRLIQSDGPTWELSTGTCPECGASVGIATPDGVIWPPGRPPSVVWDAIRGPGPGEDGVGFVPHPCWVASGKREQANLPGITRPTRDGAYPRLPQTGSQWLEPRDHS